MMDAIRDLWSDIDQAVVEVYNRAIKEAERQKATAEAKAREEARQRKLNKGYTLTLRGGTTIRKIQKYFGEDYPYLKLNFYLVKTAQGAKKSKSISHIDADLTLDQVRSFRGNCQVEIYGKSTPQSLEKEFRSKSGLVAKVCYETKEGESFYISPQNKLYTTCLYDINASLAANGYKKLS